jgi:DNA-binding SARP family transcriptional activator
MSRLYVRLFGHAQIAGDTGAARALTRGATRLLAYLVLRRGSGVERGQAASALYPDCDPQTARTQLRKNLIDLDRELRAYGLGAALERTRSSLRLATEAVRCDVWEWEEACRAGDGARALELYVDELLRDFDDDWISMVREQIARRHRQELDREIDRSLFTSHQRALVCAAALVVDDPYDERAVRRLMEVCAVHGDRGGALHAYGELAARLRTELQTAPAPETTALRNLIAGNGANSERSPSQLVRAVQDALRLHRCVTVITRSAEREVLASHIARAAAAAAPDGVHFLKDRLERPSRLAALIGRRRVCVAIDCERIDPDQAAVTIEAILHSSPHVLVTVLASEPLRINGEFVIDSAMYARA